VSEVNVTKKQIEQYLLQDEQHNYATFTLDPLVGSVQVMSSWGSWSHIWNAPGEKGLKHFLADTANNQDYICSKFAQGKTILDMDKICNALIKKIELARKNGIIQKDTKGELIDWVCAELDEESYATIPYKDELFHDVLGGDLGEIPYFSRYEYQLTSFFEKMWIPFTEVLKKELGEFKSEP
jgi:hypothetical protein